MDTNKQYLIRTLYVPFALLALSNILGWMHLLPVFLQLLLSSCSCVYIGCILSSKLQRKPSGQLGKPDIQIDQQQQVINMREALKFPIIASIFLFSFYMLYKFVDKDILNHLITLQFCLATVISTSSMLLSYFNFPAAMKNVIKHVKPYNFLKKYLDFTDFDITIASIITTFACSIPVIMFYITKHWFLNNVFGILFSITALKAINISSFKVGFILLWLLFFYDIFWVYGTDVMVSVAKNLDIPIKLVFPYINAQGVQKFSMLGLGDIVVPGIFISLCIKYDVDKSLKSVKPGSAKDVKTSYFNISFIGYILGIVQTFAAMWIFDHPQPALLFLVPMCTLTVAGLAFVNKQLKQVQNYTTQRQDVPKKQKKPEDHGYLDTIFDYVLGFFKKSDKKQ